MSAADDNKHDVLHVEQANAQGKALVVDELAAGYVDPTLHISPEENKRLRRKIYKHLLPVLCVAYITQSLDKGTLGSASIMGWQANVGAVGQDYALTSTFLWCGIIVGEPIVNQFIRRFPVAKVLAVSMVVWSILVMGLTFSLSTPPVFAIRFLLGLFESSFGPCLTTVTVQWFTAQEQTFVATIWQAMLGVAGAVSSLLGYGFYHVAGKAPLYGWQWPGVCIGLISFVATAIVFWFLPDSPVQARWATPEEKVRFVERVRSNDQGIKQKVWRADQAREAFTDPLTYLLFLMYFAQSAVVGGLNTFNSLLINQAFGIDVSSMYPMLSRNVAGQSKKSVVYALFFIAWAAGNAIGPQLFQSVWAPRYFPSLYIHLGLYAVFAADLVGMRTMLVRRNRTRENELQGENLHLHAFEDKTDLQNRDFRYSY